MLLLLTSHLQPTAPNTTHTTTTPNKLPPYYSSYNHYSRCGDLRPQPLSLLLRLLSKLPRRRQHQRDRRRHLLPPRLRPIPLVPTTPATIPALLLLLLSAAAGLCLCMFLLQRLLLPDVHEGGDEEPCCLATAC